MTKLNCGISYIRRSSLNTWHDFKQEVFSRYGSSEFEDHFDALFKLRQSGSVQEYYKKFIKLVTKAGNVTVSPQVSLFIGGLQSYIRIDVKGQKPQTLKAALSYAKLLRWLEQKGVYSCIRGSSKKSGTDSVPADNGSKDRKSLPIIKKLTPEEMMERKSRRICFNCD